MTYSLPLYSHFLLHAILSLQPSWAMNFTSENFNEVFSQKANAYQIVVAEKIAASDAKFTGEIEVSSKSLTSPPAPGEGLRAKRRASLISSQATNAAPSEVSSNSIVTLGNGIVSLAQNADSSVRSFARESSYIDFKRDSDKACSSLSHLLEARVSTSLVDILLEHANQSHGSVKSNHLLSHRISPILEEIEVTRKSMEQPQAIGRANDSEGGLIELTPMASELLGKLILARNSEQSTKSATISRTSTYQRQGSQASSLDNAFVHVNHLLEQGESKKAPHSQTSVASLTLSRKGLHPPQVPSEHRSSNQTVASTNSHPTSGQHLSAAGTSNHGDATSEASASHVSTWHTILPADMAANSQLWYGPQSAGGGSLLGSLVNTNDRSSNAAAFTRGHSGLDQNTNANPTIDLRSMMSTMMGSNYSSNQPDSRSINNSSYNVTPQALNQLSPKGSQVLQEGVTWQSVDGTSESIPGPGSVPGPSQCSASTPNTPNTTGQPNSSPPSPMIQFPVHLRLYSVMEFLDKGSLQDAVDHGLFRTIRSGREELLLPWILETMAEVASALSYMHSKGAVHGDLSAVNVLLKSSAKHPPRGWFSKVCDFGQSVRLKPGQTSIKSTSYGTVNYCSPEVLSHRLVSRASDVWSLGVLMNQCVTGHKPWKGLSPEQIMLVVGVEQKQKLQWPDGLDDEVRELGQKLLSLEPAMRPSAAEAKETLLKLLERLKIRTLNDVHAGSPASVGPLSL